MSDDLPKNLTEEKKASRPPPSKPCFVRLTRANPGNALDKHILVNMVHVTSIWQWATGQTVICLSTSIDDTVTVVESPRYILECCPEDYTA